MKALIAVDGSSGSFEAIRQAAQLMDPGRDQLAFFYSPPSINFDSDQTEPAVLERARTLLATAVFDEARQNLPEGLRDQVETIVGELPAKQGIIDAVSRCGTDWIAVGARGLGPIERLLLGSVSSSVVYSARVPVLVARPRPNDRRGEPLRVLVACESTTSDGGLADVINRLHWQTGSLGLTISVVQSMFAGHVPKWLEDRARSEEVEAMARAWVAEHDAEIRNKRTEMVTFNATLPEPFRISKPIVVEGHPAEQILSVIAAHQIDLVILGVHASSTVARFVLGSTSETVLSHAPCSVLIARKA